LPNVKDAQFRKALQKNYRTELKPTIATMLGRQDNYRAFLENNFELVYSILPQSTLNKRFKDFIEPVVDESGKQLREKTAEGKKVFKKKKITKNEFVNYFLGDNVGASTKGTRKTALSEALAEEIAFDATLDVIREPEIFNKIQTITQIAGQTFDTNYLAQVAKEIDRATDFKFSLSDAVDIMQLVAENSDMLASSFDVFFAALVKGQAAYNVSVKNRKGQALEYYVSKELEGLFGDRIKILNANELSQLKTGDTGVDIQVELDGKVFGFEVKNSISDIIGSKSGKTGILKEFGPEIANQMFELADQTNNEIIEELNRLNIPYTLNSEGFIITDKFTKDGKKVSDIINISRTKTITLNGVGPIARLYESKGVQYMYFADKGWRSLNTNDLGLNIESIHALGLDTVINVTSVAQTQQKVNAPDKTKFGIRAYYNFGKNNKVVNANTIKEGKQTNEVFLDVKASQTVNLDLEMNNIIQEKTGIDAVKVYSKAKGEMVGKKFGRGNIFIPWSAEDLNGFFYGMAGKGPKGEAALKFFNENINRPYNIAIENLNRDRMQLMDDFKALKKNIKSVPKKLKSTIPGEAFTYEQAVRIYAWNKMGYEIADLSNADLKTLNKVVIDDPALKEFGNTLIAINKGDGYPKPKDSWLAGTIETDLYSSLNEVKRAKYLEKWKENVDIVFSKKNKNKLRAAFGNTFVENLENILKRMETGRNRPAGGNKMINGWLDWINGSVGAIMFFNMRSAMLQTISMANYINWSDNNLLAASKAFANQPQFMSDFLFLFNSDYLKERRGGLKLNVQESELVEQANKNGVQGVISLILKQGFLPTRIADSFAISMGGASMYRNRVKKYTKEGLSQKEAESKAFQDFMALTEESQQSSRPDKISAEQASSLGRLFLAFANTPMQYNRMIKRASQDLINKRGDWKTNVSKITYYTFIQNFIFNAMQQALFKLAFGDEEEGKDAKLFKVGESMVDSILRGTGISGQIALTSKNVIKDIIKDEGLNDKTFLELFDLSPPLNSKVSKLRSAGYLFQYADKEQMKEINLRNPGLMALAYVLSAIANVPADRAIRKANNVESAMSEETELWQKIALIMGWNEWELGVGPDAKKQKEKKKKKKDNPLRGLDNFEKRMKKNL
jgi:hypothetical protein